LLKPKSMAVPQTQTHVSHPSTPPAPQCKTLLLAEDNPDIREALAEALEYEGYQVHAARNGKEALEFLKILKEPTLVLLDLMMPIMNGWEFLDMRKKDRDLSIHPVIVLSASGVLRKPGFSALEADGYLSKPIDLGRLLAAISKFCPGPGPRTNLAI
jgi:CheY-like chemotaxis protein